LIVTLHKIFTVLVLGIGIVHTAGTFYFYGSLSEAAIWFAGAGLGAIFVALLNIGLWPRGVSSASWRLAAVANALFFVWLAVGFWATPGPPTAFVAGTGSAMVISAMLLRRKGA